MRHATRIARTPRAGVRIARAALVPWLVLVVASLGCPTENPPLAPSAGIPYYQRFAAVPVPGGLVNAAGGNLYVAREGIRQATLLGEFAVGAAYNSATGSWLWSFDVSYDGATFVAATGASHDLTGVPEGAVIPGTVWVVIDATRLKSKGGILHEFDAAGRLRVLRRVTEPWPRLEFVGDSRTTLIRQCDAHKGVEVCDDLFHVVYDTHGVSSIESASSARTARFEFDAVGRLLRARSPAEIEAGLDGTRYEYDGGLLVAQIGCEGQRVEYAYQVASKRISRVVQVGDAATGSPTHSFAYTGEASDGTYRTIVLSPRGHRIHLRYDRERRLVRSENAETGDVVAHTWQGRNPVLRVDPNGAVTRWTWEQDEIETEILPSGNVVHMSYARHGLNPFDAFATPRSQISDSLGLVSEHGYQPLGRLFRTRNGEGEQITLSYLAGYCQGGEACLPPYDHGEVRDVTLPSGVRIRFDGRGANGRPTEIMRADVTQDRGFDAAGNQTSGFGDSLVLVEGGIGIRGHDGDGNLASIGLFATDVEGEISATGSVDIVRGGDGKVLRVTRPGGAHHEMQHDALGRLERLSEIVDGVWRDTHFEYDLSGNPTAMERANGMRIEMDHDAADRVVARRILRHGVVEGEAHFTWVGGELREYYDSVRGGSEVYEYDLAGRRARTTYPSGEVLDVEYDLRSRVVLETWRIPGRPDEDVARGYDLADREIRVTHQGNLLLEREFAAGQLREIRYGNGLVRAFEYEVESGDLLASETLDAWGNRIAESTLARQGVVPVSGSPYWEITSSTTTHGAATRVADEVYRLGPVGTAAPRVFSYANGVDPDRVYAYDERGNQVDADADGCGNRREFDYDSEGSRLLRAVLSHCEGPDTVYSYGYDEAGFVTSRNGLPITWTADGRIASIGDDGFGWDLLGRPVSWSAAGVVQSWTLFGGRVTDAGVLDLGAVSIRLGADDPRYRHFDFRRNVSFVTDAEGRVVQHFRYHPYGVDAELVGGEAERVSFAGGAEIGDVMLLGERVYDPAVGRFLSPDARFNWVNTYAYTLGNPIWFWDPEGAQSQPNTGAAVERAAIELGVASVALTGAMAAAWFAPPVVGTPVLLAAVGAWVLAVDNLRRAVEADLAEQGEGLGSESGSSPDIGPGSGGGGPLGFSGSYCGLGGPEIMLALLVLLCSRRMRGRLGGFHV